MYTPGRLAMQCPSPNAMCTLLSQGSQSRLVQPACVAAAGEERLWGGAVAAIEAAAEEEEEGV